MRRLEPGHYRKVQEGSQVGVLQDCPAGRVDDGVELRGSVEDSGFLSKKIAEPGLSEFPPFMARSSCLRRYSPLPPGGIS